MQLAVCFKKVSQTLSGPKLRTTDYRDKSTIDTTVLTLYRIHSRIIITLFCSCFCSCSFLLLFLYRAYLSISYLPPVPHPPYMTPSPLSLCFPHRWTHSERLMSSNQKIAVPEFLNFISLSNPWTGLKQLWPYVFSSLSPLWDCSLSHLQFKLRSRDLPLAPNYSGTEHLSGNWPVRPL